jgi:hypothetical protein
VHLAGTLLLGTVMVAACASAPSGDAPGTTSSDPPLAQELGVTCGPSLPFDPALLDTAGHAETDPDDAAEALRRRIVFDAVTGMPTTGWIRVVETGDRVDFVAPFAGPEEQMVATFVRARGGWTLDNSATCTLETAAPPGTSRAEWWLDPAFPRPVQADKTIHILLVERACAGGRPPEGRVEPRISITQDEMRVTIFVREIPGDRDCPGNPVFAMPLELPQPLGPRFLLDAGLFPPREPRPPG